MRLEFSTRAERDLEHILKLSGRSHRSGIARQYGLKIRDKYFQICSAPGLGNRHPIYPKIRKVVIGAHKIFYRIEKERIIIHRIWDGRRGKQPNLD